MNGPDLLLDSLIPTAALPEVRNHTQFPSQYFQMLDVSDEVFHVIVSRLTYDLKHLNESGEPQLAQQQVPLVLADQYYGDLASSSLIQESDLAPYKPKCDIVFANTCAYAPQGKPLQRWPVGMRIGQWQKTLAVTGMRYVDRGLLGWHVTEPAKTTEVPLRWELAYGGSCRWPMFAQPEQAQLEAIYEANPIGVGWVDSAWLKKSQVADVDAPQIEIMGQPFDSIHANAMRYDSVGVGAVSKWWSPRRQKAGSFDQAWKETRWPALPKDFDFGYWNAAPQDQQIDYPQGGEPIALVGLLPAGQQLRCVLPQPALHAVLRMNIGPIVHLPMRLDTLVFDMKEMTLSCVYRIQIAAQFGARVLELRPGRAPL